MGWFGKLTPDELREKLFDARGGELAALCKKHRDAIFENFASWQKVPEAVRKDPQALPRYGQGLIGVAQCFAQLGDASLLEKLMGGGKNPLTEWQQGLAEARHLLDEGRFADAIPKLEAMREAASKLQGSGVDKYLPFTLEYLGEARFHSGQPEAAVEPFELALDLAQDDDARLACLNSLYETHRYLGNFERAAEYAAQKATIDPRQIAAPSPEPLLRVVLQMDDRRYEQGEAPPPNGRVQFLLVRNRVSLRAADLLTAEGGELASQGRYQEALARFEEAAKIDVFDPQSRFLGALTLLHLRRYDEAVKLYAEVERLAPGWYQSRHDAWLADQLACGKLTHEAFLAHLELEDGNLPPEELLRFSDQFVHWPLPSAYLHRGRALKALGRKDEAAAAFRRGLTLAGDADIRARLSLELGMLLDDDQLLQAAEDPAGNPVTAAQARLIRRSRRS